VLIIILFLVYKFFPKIDRFLKQYLSSQRVINIKTEMKTVDNLWSKTNKHQQNDNKKGQSINETIIEKVYTIAFIPFDYLYRGILSYFPTLGKKYER